MKGNIFNIQKFSIHDGPGVRTTVFLKGCPLRCKWCANPESQSTNIQVTYEARKCAGCLTCIRVCPGQCISCKPSYAQPEYMTNTLSNDTQTERTISVISIDHQKCVGCLTCVSNCPMHALKAEGEAINLDKVVEVCLQDIDFYEESGGGVTLSGGECMCQPEFTEALTMELKKYNIHVAAEITGYIKKEIFQKLAPMFDLLLFDVKQYDSAKHFAGTGVHNELIIENLTWAFEQDLNILPRIPVIPRFNAELEDAEGISDLLLSIGLRKSQLLPFHQFGERKYELLNQDYSYKKIKALYPEDLKEYQQIFLNKEIQCFI